MRRPGEGRPSPGEQPHRLEERWSRRTAGAPSTAAAAGWRAATRGRKQGNRVDRRQHGAWIQARRGEIRWVGSSEKEGKGEEADDATVAWSQEGRWLGGREGKKYT